MAQTEATQAATIFQEPLFLTAREAAKRVQVTERLVRDAAVAGRLKVLRLSPTVTRFRPRDVDRWARSLGAGRLIDIEEIIARPTVYRLYNKRGTLLYVGSTTNVGARLQNHRGSQPWWPQVRKVRLDHFETIAEARSTEGEAIYAERPRHNKVGVW